MQKCLKYAANNKLQWIFRPNLNIYSFPESGISSHDWIWGFVYTASR